MAWSSEAPTTSPTAQPPRPCASSTESSRVMSETYVARQVCSSGSALSSLPAVRNHTCERGSTGSPMLPQGGVVA